MCAAVRDQVGAAMPAMPNPNCVKTWEQANHKRAPHVLCMMHLPNMSTCHVVPAAIREPRLSGLGCGLALRLLVERGQLLAHQLAPLGIGLVEVAELGR